MTSRTLTVERSTSTAHRLLHYDGVCGNVHGHNIEWQIEMIVRMDDTGEDNMPLDFKEVSDIIDLTDHAVLLNKEDPLVDVALTYEDVDLAHDQSGHEYWQGHLELLGEVILFYGDPTCELLTQWMAEKLVDLPQVLRADVIARETEKYGMYASATTWSHDEERDDS